MKAFYCGVLGCTVDRHNEEFGLFQVRAGAHLIDLIPIDGKLGSRGGPAPGDDGLNLDHFAIRIEPFNEPELRAYLEHHNIEIVEAGRAMVLKGRVPAFTCSIPKGTPLNSKGRPTRP